MLCDMWLSIYASWKHLHAREWNFRGGCVTPTDSWKAWALTAHPKGRRGSEFYIPKDDGTACESLIHYAHAMAHEWWSVVEAAGRRRPNTYYALRCHVRTTARISGDRTQLPVRIQCLDVHFIAVKVLWIWLVTSHAKQSRHRRTFAKDWTLHTSGAYVPS